MDQEIGLYRVAHRVIPVELAIGVRKEETRARATEYVQYSDITALLGVQA